MATNNAVNTSLSGQTGTGTFVGNTSPVLVTPALGTPSSGTLTSCTGLPLSAITGASGSSGTLLRSNGTNWSPTAATYPNSYIINSLLYSTSTTSVAGLSTANSSVLVTSGTGVPSWSTTIPNIAIGTPTSGTLTNCTGLPVAGGGTGVASFTTYAVICGGTTTTGAVQSIASVGSSGQILTSNGAGALPTFQAGGAVSGSLLNVQVFKTSGTYTPTTGMSNCIIQAVGGGGAGGGAQVSGLTTTFGGGGGSGGFSQSYVTSATIGASQTVTIGAGGTGVSGGAGNNGSATSVGSIVIANGGSGGSLILGSSALGGSGGTVGTGNVSFSGGVGSNGFIVGTSGTSSISGSGGNSFFAGGGSPTVVTFGASVSNAGNAGSSNSGGGGSGASQSSGVANTGGAGAAGVIIIYEYK